MNTVIQLRHSQSEKPRALSDAHFPEAIRVSFCIQIPQIQLTDLVKS
jgi:hypothetical protein